MKVLIEIDEHNKNVIDRFADEEGYDILPERIFASLIESFVKGTPIPDNATNGDVIKALFPDYNKHLSWFFDWWNSPYKADKER